MKKIYELIFGAPYDPNDWILRMRAVTSGQIGPRYPTGLFVIDQRGSK